MPTDAKLQDSVELPEPVTLVGLRVHAVLLLDRLTTPVNPPTEATVMAAVTAAFAKPVTLVGLAETVKSVTWTSTVVVLDNEPLVLVTFAE